MNCKWHSFHLLKKRLVAATVLFLAVFVSLPAAAKTQETSRRTFSEQVEIAKTVDVSNEVLLLLSQEVLENKLDTKEAECLLARLVAARAEHLPIAVLEEKVLEGRAKGIQASTICKAIRTMIDQMLFSKQLLASKTKRVPSENIVRRMFEIHAQGLSRKQQTEFVSAYAARDIESILDGLRLYALLRQTGVSSEKLQAFITLVMSDDAVLMRWKEIPQLFSIVAARGIMPDEFMYEAISAVEAGTLPKDFARNLSLQPRSLGATEMQQND